MTVVGPCVAGGYSFDTKAFPCRIIDGYLIAKDGGEGARKNAAFRNWSYSTTISFQFTTLFVALTAPSHRRPSGVTDTYSLNQAATLVLTMHVCDFRAQGRKGGVQFLGKSLKFTKCSQIPSLIVGGL